MIDIVILIDIVLYIDNILLILETVNISVVVSPICEMTTWLFSTFFPCSHFAHMEKVLEFQVFSPCSHFDFMASFNSY